MSRVRAAFALACVAATLGFAGGPALASAGAAELDVRGVWEAGACTKGSLAECEAAPEYPQKLNIETENFTTGALTGWGETTAGEKVAVFTGSISGCVIKTHDTQGTYESEGSLTLSADGKKLQGTFSDTNGRVNQPSWASRASGPGCGSAPTEGEETKKEEKKGLRPTATSVICNYELATSQDICGASVGDGGSGTPVTPTGAVKFTATNGGFAGSAACNLTPTPLSPSVASCTVVFFASGSHLPTVTAAYAGDANHNGSTGQTQFLSAGIEEPELAQGGPSGKYPNELQLETTVPTAGTSVEAGVGTPQSRPEPVPLAQPPVSGLDPVSANDLRGVEALAMLSDLDGGQDETVMKQLDASIEKLDARAVEIGNSPSAAERAEAQKLINETNTELEAVTRMQKELNENVAALAAQRAAPLLFKADVKLEKADETIVELDASPAAADQLRAQQDLESANSALESISKAVRQHEELTKKVIQGIKASAARAHGRRISLLRVHALGHAAASGLPAGKAKLRVKLSSSRVKAAAGRRRSLGVVVRTVMVLPSKLLKGGLPRIVVQSTVLRKR